MDIGNLFMAIGVFSLCAWVILFLSRKAGITIESEKQEVQTEPDFPELENEIEELKEEIRKQERMKQLETERNRLEVELNGFNQDGEIDYEKAYKYIKECITNDFHSAKKRDLIGYSTSDYYLSVGLGSLLDKINHFEQNT